MYLFTRNCGGGGGVEGAGFINFAYAGSFVGQPLVEEKNKITTKSPSAREHIQKLLMTVKAHQLNYNTNSFLS